jgi:hypothetical protein
VYFNARICSQCFVADCTRKAKGEACRVQTGKVSPGIPEWQVREQYAQLLIEHAKLIDESQRLVRIISGINPALLEGKAA